MSVDSGSVEAVLRKFYAYDLFVASKACGIALHKGGYEPTATKNWSLDDLSMRGSPSGKTMRCNPNYVNITGEIKRNSLAEILRIRHSGKNVMWFGGTEVAELNEEMDFLSPCAFESDFVRYTATRDAGAMGADLRALGIDKEYALVFILPPSYIQHQGRLNEAQYERMWRLKKKNPRLCWQTVGDSIKIVLLLPYEEHRIESMESRTVIDKE